MFVVQHACGGQETTCRYHLSFFFFNICVPGLNLGAWGQLPWPAEQCQQCFIFFPGHCKVTFFSIRFKSDNLRRVVFLSSKCHYFNSCSWQFREVCLSLLCCFRQSDSGRRWQWGHHGEESIIASCPVAARCLRGVELCVASERRGTLHRYGPCLHGTQKPVGAGLGTPAPGSNFRTGSLVWSLSGFQKQEPEDYGVWSSRV